MFSIPLGWRDFVATVFLWPATDVMTESLLPVAWTLTFELMFYVCAALVIKGRKWIYLLIGVYVAAFCLRPVSPTFKILGSPLIIEFLLGVLIARLPMMRMAIWGILIGCAAILATAHLKLLPFGTWPFSDEGEVARLIFFGLPAGLIVYGVMQIEATKGFWTYVRECGPTCFGGAALSATG
jgi:exopolysaccharide production protein ExoZ